jgi:hypothetical protein
VLLLPWRAPLRGGPAGRAAADDQNVNFEGFAIGHAIC